MDIYDGTCGHAPWICQKRLDAMRIAPIKAIFRQKRFDAVRIGPIKAIFRHIMGDYGVFVAWISHYI